MGTDEDTEVNLYNPLCCLNIPNDDLIVLLEADHNFGPIH